MDSCTVFVAGISNVDKIRLEAPLSMSVEQLKQRIRDKLPQGMLARVGISTAGGLSINKYATLGELYNGTTVADDDDAGTGSGSGSGGSKKFIDLQLTVCLCGGKGGFGELLKQRARTTRRKHGKNSQSSSKDLYRTLDGRRVKNVKRLKQLEDYINTLDEAESQKFKEKRAKLEKILDVDLEKNVKFDDMDFLEDVEKQIEEIRNAVSYDYEDIDSDSSDSNANDSDSDSDSDSESSEDEKPSSSKQQKSCNFASFFDEAPGGPSPSSPSAANNSKTPKDPKKKKK
jgi:hypothetical protein